ncbi:hypothetical protein [Seohaeicola zhoushanensis]|uniref:Uncharacterized protein n=1 Tax=Seohaeicola zhoushanensis TaxID=1569283 RepID=A0A8J3GX38_9RHOB|nr:hypothetical protein [Seohaeicola zhoushanensis]GHF48384.1 hypothetical protein GCM10017056_19910 [Seohaeicola zhoushanensis]
MQGKTITRQPVLSALAAVLLLAGCLETGTGATAVKGRAAYQKVAVVPLMTQNLLSVHYTRALADPAQTQGRIDWNLAAATGRAAQQVLAEAGASAQVTASGSAAARNADVVVTLAQAPLDWLSLVYDPGRDFLLQGIIGAAVGAQNRDQRYQPRVVVTLMLPEKSGMLGKSACAVGVKAVVSDPRTGTVLREGRAIAGVRQIEQPIHGASWASIPPDEKRVVLAHCESALRSAIVQALGDAEVIR